MTSGNCNSDITARETPWSTLDADGTGLIVHDFLTTKLSALMNSLRRKVTSVYAADAGLSVPEWRVLSLVAHARTISFGSLVVQSTADKSQVSRTVRRLEDRNMLSVAFESEHDKKRIACSITSEGQVLHDQTIARARKMQAEVIRHLEPRERDHLYRTVEKLQACMDDEDEMLARKENNKVVRSQASK